ncbi:MAG: Crp/Fnr family transcriptional regulator [Thiogranum sp.]|nr:Crp/Fnr family transcriptional regulator [Thiogranum sp.]
MSKARIETTHSWNGSTHHLANEFIGDSIYSSSSPLTLWQEAKPKRFVAQSVIYRESDSIDRVYVVRGGMVKLLSYLPNGRARIVRLHARNHWIGLEGLLGHTYEHTAIAVGDVEVQHISIHSLRRLYRDDPRALGELLHQWHGDLAQADRWISDFSTGGIKSRVARLLEYLAELECGEPSDQVELLTVHEMAEIIGVTQESVSRILAAFKRNAILQRQTDPQREIYRLDTGKLQHEARK